MRKRHWAEEKSADGKGKNWTNLPIPPARRCGTVVYAIATWQPFQLEIDSLKSAILSGNEDEIVIRNSIGGMYL